MLGSFVCLTFVSLCVLKLVALVHFGQCFLLLNVWSSASKLSYNNFCFQISMPLHSLLLPCFRVFLCGRMLQKWLPMTPKDSVQNTHTCRLSWIALSGGNQLPSCADPQAVPWRGSSGGALRPLSVSMCMGDLGNDSSPPLKGSRGRSPPQPPSWP